MSFGQPAFLTPVVDDRAGIVVIGAGPEGGA
jgi:hypothetical protein